MEKPAKNILGHGGLIWAENRPDGGARVAFTLPVARTNSLTVAAAAD